MWIVHWSLLLKLPWRTCVWPSEGQMWWWCSCLSHRVLAAPGTQGSWRLGQQEIQCSRRVWQPILANMLQYSCLENNPLPDRGAWKATVYRVTKSRTRPKWLCTHRHKTFCLWHLCPSESWAWRWRSCLACREPGGAKYAGTRTSSTAVVMALSFFPASCSCDQKGSLASLSP